MFVNVMKKQYTNPCTRCGKERILVKEWIDKIPTFSGGFVEVTRTENACPEPECQAIVQKDLDGQKEKRDKMKQDREDRLKENTLKKAQLKLANRKIE